MDRRSHPLVVCLASLVLAIAAPAAAQPETCAERVQGRIAWDYAGSRQWQPANLERLCPGAEESAAPAECFQEVMHGGVEHGHGTRWRWQDALDLCAGTLDAAASVGCFRNQVAAGRTQEQAIETCRWDGSAHAEDAPGAASPSRPAPLPRPLPMSPRSIPQREQFSPEPVPEATTWTASEATVNHVNGEPLIAASRPLRGATGLRSFKLQFRRDHKIRRVTVSGDDRFARFAFNDQGGEDTFWAEAEWAVFSAGRTASITAAARGQVELEIEPSPPGHTFVLSGFEFRRLDGTDANVRSLGIWPLLDRNVLQVWLLDDMGPDFRGLEETLGASLAAGALVPYGGAIVGGLASTWDAVSRFNAQGGARPYQVTIQYAWVPDDVFGEDGAASGTSSRNEDGWQPGAHVLQGFRFVFENSDHHLGALGVSLGDEQYNVHFRDSDWDDPLQWAVQYKELRAGRRR